jgi:hypothetical protein
MRVLPLVGLSFLLALTVACQRPQSNSPQGSETAASGVAQAPAPGATGDNASSAPQGIGWFKGGVPEAFAAAKRTGRPVLLFWGAVWCPFCHTLKATVFVRPDFISKTRLFVPVYLDGDDAGAQAWGERFGVLGYPTLVVLDPDQHEILRLGAGHDVSEYASVLDVALEDLQPIDSVLPLAAAGKPLSADQCRRLAFNEWTLDSIESQRYAPQAAALQAASQACPAGPERANLAIYAAAFESQSEAAAKGKHGVVSPRLSALMDQVSAVLAQPELALASAPALMALDASFFQAAQRRSPAVAQQLRDRYVATMDAAASAPRFVVADQLGFLDAKLNALKSLAAPHEQLPAELLKSADARIDAALDAEKSLYVRPGLVNAALNILEDTDQYDQAYQIAKAEIDRSETPYYYQADLAEIAEKLGHKDEAIHLLDVAYHGARGPATRFQWGSLYVSGLLRMAPNQDQRIEQAALEVIGELDGPDRIAARARVRLTRLDQELRHWNSAAKGGHQQILQALHSRAQQICVKIPASQPERTTCDAFLSDAA